MKKTTYFFSLQLLYRVFFVVIIHMILSVILSLSTAPNHLIENADFLSVDLLRFSLAKAMITLSNLFTFDILIATSIYFIELNYNNMLIPILTAGYSRFNMLRLFIPAFIVLGSINFSILEYAQRWSDSTLRSLKATDFEFLNYSNKKSIWLQNGTDILYLEKDEYDNRLYHNTKFFKRNSEGHILYVQKSKNMIKKKKTMLFSHVNTYFMDDLKHRYEKEVQHPILFSFEAINFLNLSPNNIPISRLYTLSQTSHSGIVSPFIYKASFYNRLSGFIKPFGVIILVISLIPIVRRNSQYGLFFLSITILGFSSFLLDKIFVLIAGHGIIAPYFSGNITVLLQVIVATALLLRHEKLGK